VPSIKCAECGHRILLPSVLAICPNCGTLLPSRAEAQSQSEESQPTAALLPVSSSSHGQARQCPLCEAPLPCPLNTTICPHCGTSLISPGKEVITTTSRSAATTTRQQPPALDVPPDIYVHLPPGAMPEHPNLFAAPPLQLPPSQRGRYPFWFPRRAPDLEGVIVQVQSQLENPAPPGLSTALFRQLRDMIWALNSPEIPQQKEQVMITMMRIRTSDGTQKDARLEGYLTGANPSLGDTISLWGWQRKGILRVRRGYNHTTRGIISTTAMTSPLPALLLIAGLLIALLLLSHWYHLPLLPHRP
jgi:uncharacterized Zn finger protein (UPF0148 family)